MAARTSSATKPRFPRFPIGFVSRRELEARERTPLDLRLQITVAADSALTDDDVASK